MKHTVTLTVNDRAVAAEVEPRTHLADFLREVLLLTGTHLGCEHGVCGACTVLIDGAPARACIAYAVMCDGAKVQTIEGFASDALMNALRDAFSRHHALQCGYCTPGMLITAHDIVSRLGAVDERRVREELAGNLCRCTGYMGIVRAIKEVSSTWRNATEQRGYAHPPVAIARKERHPLPVALSPGFRQPQHSMQGDKTGPAHRAQVPVPVVQLWAVLRDPHAVVQCMPGATLLSAADADPLEFELAVAIGPMRACFKGTASIEYDDANMRGELSGHGTDSTTRSSGQGRVGFAAHHLDEQSAEVQATIAYTLSGPLAQFSRGAIIDAVLDQLLDDFAQNLARAAAGEAAAPARELSGLKLALKALRSRIRKGGAS